MSPPCFTPPHAGRWQRRHCWLLLVWPAAACAQNRNEDADALAQQWQRLRTLPGHFDGAPWNDEVDRWQGRKHQLMQALAQRAREQVATEARLLQWMGPPDARWQPGQPEHADAVQRAQWQSTPSAAMPDRARGELLVYNWRGRHDRLVFALHAGRVAATAWLFNLE